MELGTGYLAFVLVAASLVLLMTPGLALFYGGMTRSKGVLNMMMMSFGAMAIIAPIYVLWGFSMSYSDTLGANASGSDIAMLFANPFHQFGLDGVQGALGEDGSGALITVGFQMTFAIITTALVSGAIADRVKYSAWLVFVPFWVTFSYFPLAHMVFGGGFLSGSEGGLADMLFSGDGGANTAPIDYAGGTAVHINAGVAGLVLALVIGKRIGFGTRPMRPHNLPLVMLGAGLLWFGWFGFNVGSWIPAEGLDDGTYWAGETGLVWVNTTVCAAAAILGWIVIEKIRDGKATSLGAASGVVAGLVAITPACGALSPVGSIILGLVTGALCALAVGLKYKFGFDDSLDVVGVHLVGGLVGTIAIGFLGTSTGLFYGGGIEQLVVQTAIALFAILWSGIITLVIALAIKVVIGWRVDEDDEENAIDSSEHGESGYDLAGAVGGRTGTVPTTEKDGI
ncbi:ammonium transporter [Nocardioides alkalitolerans]|uniref:ammonium transporter n=1 Tax=Nocardioides alkalitolerans TaxID=281714 RepID=UPI00041116A7|nr:ammonium transporter [Nocardioides alkalitolerans]